MPTAPGYCDVSIEHTLTGFTRPAYVTFGVDPTATDPLIVAGSILAAIQASNSYKSITALTVTLTGIRVAMGTDGTADLSVDYPISVVGGASGAKTPAQVAVLCHKRTARGGRRGRGRMFIPWGVSESDVGEAGNIGTSALATINTAMGNFLTALQTQAVPMVILHGEGLTPLGAPDLVTSLVCDAVTSTQRRRLGR
jgi:hypothetical protein